MTLKDALEFSTASIGVRSKVRWLLGLDPDACPSPVDIALGLCKLASQAFGAVTFIIDGLDECDIPEDRRQLLEFLRKLGEAPQGSIKTIVTSRTIYDIRTTFRGFPNISIAASSTDVKLFVAGDLEQRLRSEVEFYGIRFTDPTLKTEIIERLVSGASGM